MIQTQTEAREGAEDEIFALRKKSNLYLLAGDIEEFNRIQTNISELQMQGAVTGKGKDEHDDRTV